MLIDRSHVVVNRGVEPDGSRHSHGAVEVVASMDGAVSVGL